MNEIIVHSKPKSPISEAYRSLRTNIQFSNIDKQIKTIMITSATPREGKTLTLANLAVSMVQNGDRVLVVDCDMRKPRLHKVFNISNLHGLSDYLAGNNTIDEYIQKLDVMDMDVITAGWIPSNPSELLHSKKMKNLVEELRERYDFILFDTPPVAPVTDAVVMSHYIDGVVMVIASGQVDIEMAKKVKDSLSMVGMNIIGVVLNKITEKDLRKYQSYYHYYYYYYDNEEKKKREK